jgi:hypothetical protein
MHVIARAAGPAQAAGDQRMHDNRVTYLDVGYCRSDFVYPSRALVTERIGQLHTLCLMDFFEVPVFEVEVGSAESRRTDHYDNVERPVSLRFVDLVDMQVFVVVV